MRKILPILLALIGLGAGGAAGYFLRPPPPAPEAGTTEHTEAPAETATGHGSAPSENAHGSEGDAGGEATVEYVKLNNQFVVPVITRGAVSSLVVLSLSVEVTAGNTEKVYAAEPKIRDTLLQVLFDHANAGGFEGEFTETAKMEDLRSALTEATRTILGDIVKEVLISDIARQDSA